jgi:quinohemoprotein ethanol dehydrogenase
MQPTRLRVPVGTTVTFKNPGAETFPNFPNLQPHCATQFFEGEFNAKLNPGEIYQHTFDRAGEYYFNDCTDPRPTGMIEVYLDPQDEPGAVTFTPGKLDLSSETGIFTGVDGKVSAHFELPAGYEYESGAVLQTPLSSTPVKATEVTANKNRVIVQFEKADLDNNVPEGEIALTLVVNVLHEGVQKQLTSTTTVTIIK